MHRIWMGTDPHVVMAGLGTFVVGCALIIHVWAYGITGWPKYAKAKYNPQTPAAATR